MARYHTVEQTHRFQPDPIKGSRFIATVVPVCTPKAASCDGAKAMVCSSRGTKSSVVETCGTGKACVAGKCVVAECSPGEANCVGNTLVRCLDGETTWQKTVCSKEESCDPTGGPNGEPACKEQICLPGTAACDAGKAMVCSKDGLKQELTEDCAKAGKDGKARVCLTGKCVAKVCTPGEKTCFGNEVATCSDNRVDWSKAACAKGEICTAGKCAKKKCVPGETFCDGMKVTQCGADGVTTKVSHVCDANLQECKGGACVDAAIVCGDGFCDQGESIENCNTDCKQAPGIAPDFDHVAPEAKTTLPRAPRSLKNKAPHASHTGQMMAVGTKWLYVVDRDNGALVLMDIDNLAVAHTLKVGNWPDQVLVAPDGTVYVSVRNDGAVLRLPAGKTSMADAVKWQVGVEPMGLAMDPSGKALLVTLWGEGALIAIDAKTGAELGRATVRDLPRNVTARPDGKAVVLHGGEEVALVPINALIAGNPLKPVTVKASFAMLRTANPVRVCRGKLEIASRSPNRSISSTVDPDTGDVLVSHVLVSFGDAQSVLLTAGVKPKVKPPPKPIKVCSTGGYGSTCKIIPPPPGKPPCFSSPVRPYEVSVSTLPEGKVQIEANGNDVAVIDPISKRSFLSRFDQPASITHHPILTTAFVAATGTNNVMMLNTAAMDPMQSPFGDIKVGGGPRAVVISADGNKAWVLNSTSFTVSEVDLTALMKYHDATNAKKGFTQLQKIQPIFLTHNKEVAYGTDPLPETARLGRKVFHNSKNSRLSASNRFACATCHLDGAEDKRVWFVADGPRQTPALAGRIKGTAPFNWLGSKFTLIDNFKATSARMGGTGLLDKELAGLE